MAYYRCNKLTNVVYQSRPASINNFRTPCFFTTQTYTHFLRIYFVGLSTYNKYDINFLALMFKKKKHLAILKSEIDKVTPFYGI